MKSFTQETTGTVYIHGLFGSSLDFSFFKEKGGTVIDLEEFDDVDLNLENIAKNIYLHLKSLHFSCFNLVGYSLGGRIACYLKNLDPLFFKKCILIGTKLTLHPNEVIDRIIFQINWEIAYAKLEPSFFFEKWYKQSIFSSFDFKSHLEKRVSINKRFHQKCLNKLSILTQNDFEQLLKIHQKELLFLFGENDIPYKNYYENIKKIGYQVLGIKDASHPVFLENPTETYNIINWFFYDAHERKTNTQMD